MKRSFRQIRTPDLVTIEVSAPTGNYRPAARDLVLELWNERQPSGVFIKTGTGDKEPLTGWSFKNGMLTLKTKDSYQPMRFSIDY